MRISSILSPWMGWVFPAQLLQMLHSRHLQLWVSVAVRFCPFSWSQSVSLHLSLPSNSLCTGPGLILSPWMLNKSWAQRKRLRSVIPAGFPSCALKVIHHVHWICFDMQALSPSLGFLASCIPQYIAISANLSSFLHVSSAFSTSFSSLCPVLPDSEALAQIVTFFSCMIPPELNPSADFSFLLF